MTPALDTIVATLLALEPAAPINQHDHLTFVGASQEALDDGLEDFAELYVDGEDIETSYDLYEDEQP